MAGNSFNAAIGMAIVPPGEPAVDPISDASWDGWMYHRVISLENIVLEQQADNTVARIHSSLSAGMDFRADVRAQRKIPQGLVLLISIAFQAVVDQAAQDVEFEFVFGGRVLMMEK